MALITLPQKVYWDKAKLQLLRAGVTLRSKYTGKRQSVTYPFALWTFEGALLPMEGVDAAEWRSFLAELEGEQNTFQLPVPGVVGPVTGYSGPSPSTSGSALARAKSFNVSGVTPGAALFRRGDYFTVNGELKLAKTAATANGSGVATVSFEPGLRQALPGASALNIYSPYATLSATGDDVATWELSKPVRHGIKVKGMEAF